MIMVVKGMLILRCVCHLYSEIIFLQSTSGRSSW